MPHATAWAYGKLVESQFWLRFIFRVSHRRLPRLKSEALAVVFRADRIIEMIHVRMPADARPFSNALLDGKVFPEKFLERLLSVCPGRQRLVEGDLDQLAIRVANGRITQQLVCQFFLR
jgi:hypothetical protein